MESRETYLAQADRLLRKENFSKEDKSKVDSLLALADSLGPGMMALKRAKLAQSELELGIRTRENSGATEVEAEFRDYLRHGREVLLSDTSRRAMERAPIMVDATPQQRAQGQATGSVGGAIVPASFADRLESSLVAGDRIFEVARLFETATGSAFNHPLVDDQNPANKATIVGENAVSVSGPDMSFAAGITWGVCPTWRSGHLIASMELAADCKFDLSTLIADASAVRIARGVGSYFVSVLLGDAVSAFTSASASAVTADELFDLVASVDDSFGMNGSWLMRLSSLQSIWKLKNTNSTYYFPPERDAAGHPLLMGFPVYLSPSMAPLQANAKAISFGNHARFYRRQVQNSLQVKVFVERYAASGQIGYETYLRCDGHLMKAPDFGSPVVSQSPVKYITMHS